MGPPPKKRRRVVPPTQSESELVSNRPVRASKSTYRRSAVDHEQQNLNNQPVIDYAKLAEEILKKKKKKNTRQPAVPGLISGNEPSQCSQPIHNLTSQSIGTTHQPGTSQNNVLPRSQPQAHTCSSSHIPSLDFQSITEQPPAAVENILPSSSATPPQHNQIQNLVDSIFNQCPPSSVTGRDLCHGPIIDLSGAYH